MVEYQIVVSAENSPYMAWQIALFCYSALTNAAAKVKPIVVVHGPPEPLLPAFRLVHAAGCHVVRAKQYWGLPGRREYRPGNTIMTLLAALRHLQCDHMLLCDPDMIFNRPPVYDYPFCADEYDYMDYTQDPVRAAIERARLPESAARELTENSRFGVPYLIPAVSGARIGLRWLQVMDFFSEPRWEDVMYAFGIAAMAEGLAVRRTRFVEHNLRPMNPSVKEMIHYCYGDKTWSKRKFCPLRELGGIQAPLGSIMGQIINQLSLSAEYFSETQRLTIGKSGNGASADVSGALLNSGSGLKPESLN
jgi:hypothetical protein